MLEDRMSEYLTVKALNKNRDLVIKKEVRGIRIGIKTSSNTPFISNEILLDKTEVLEKLLKNIEIVMCKQADSMRLTSHHTEDNIKVTRVDYHRSFKVRDALVLDIRQYVGDHSSNLDKITISKDSARNLYKVIRAAIKADKETEEDYNRVMNNVR